MRTLSEITDAARRNEVLCFEELQYAVCAYDVLMFQLQLDKNPEQLEHYFIAAKSDPKEYIGPKNDPAELETVAWHKAFINVGKKGKN